MKKIIPLVLIFSLLFTVFAFGNPPEFLYESFQEQELVNWERVALNVAVWFGAVMVNVVFFGGALPI